MASAVAAPDTGMDYGQFIMLPLSFLLMFSFSITNSVTMDLVIYQTCKTMTDVNDTECDLLHSNSSSHEAMSVEKLVQPHTTNVFILKSYIETIFPTMMSVFLGPWSDKNGRKPLLFFPFFGYLLHYGSMAFLSNYNLIPYWFLIPSALSALFGGFPAMALTFICYLTDITNDDNRPWNLACLDTTYIIGILTGQLLGPVIFKEYGYMAVFVVLSFLCLFALLYIHTCVKETVMVENGRDFKSIFNISLVKELIGVVSKKREGFDRLLVWACVLVITVHIIITEGNVAIGFLFTSSKLGWNISDYSIYSGTVLLLSIFGIQFLIKLVGPILKLPETMIIVLASLSHSACNLVRAFAQKPWHMYYSAGLGMFGSSAISMTRSIISKTVPQKDLGKVFSITTITEMIVPLAITPFYLYVYSRTLTMFPSPVYFISAVLPLIIIILTVIIQRRWSRLKNTRYTTFVETENQ